MTLLEFCWDFFPGEEIFSAGEEGMTVQSCRLLELEYAGKESGRLSREQVLPSDILELVQPGAWNCYDPRRGEDDRRCRNGARSFLLTQEALQTLRRFRLVMDTQAVGMEHERRPYFRVRGRPVTEEQAFDILRRTNMPPTYDTVMERYSWKDLVHSGGFLDNEWFSWSPRGWVRPDGTVGMNSVSGIKYPYEREIMADIIPIELAFPYLDLVIAITDWDEAPDYAWDVFFGKVGDKYTYDGDDEVFEREDYPDFPEHIVCGVWLHDSTVELMAPERAREKYLEYNRLYGGPDEEIFKESFYKNKNLFPVDTEYLKRLIRAHGLEPEEVLAGYAWGPLGLQRQCREPEPAAAQGGPDAVWPSAQLQIGRDHRLAGRLEEARTVLEETLQGLAALDREAGRACSPKTLLCAELLCQSYDDLNIEAHGLWDERLARVQKWMRSLDYKVTGEEPLEELLDWQEWVNVSHAAFGVHSGREGADLAERLRRIAGLERQVVDGLKKHLDERHPAVLDAQMTLVNIYLNREMSTGSAVTAGDPDYSEYLADTMSGPLGRAREKKRYALPDPEAVLATCRELVELYTVAMGREDPGTYQAKDLLAVACEAASCLEQAIPLRLELWAYYRSAHGERDKEALRQNALLIEDNRLAGRWSEAIALQTRRLEQVRTAACPELRPEWEHDRLCTLYLSRLWQDESLPRDQAGEHLAGLLALTEELKPRDRSRYLDSAWQWCQAYVKDGLDEVTLDVALALADSLGSFRENEVIELLEPYAEESTLSDARRCGVLLRLGRAYRDTWDGKEWSAELLEELVELLEAHPELKDPDLGTVLLELGLSRRKLAVSSFGERFQRAAREMLEAFRGALAWREKHLSPEDPAVDVARFELAGALVWVGRREEAIPLLETVAAFRRDTLGEDAGQTVEAELELVKALARTEGRHEEARALFRHAEQIAEERRLPLFTDTARYALYRGWGGELSFTEWQEAGEPERG